MLVIQADMGDAMRRLTWRTVSPNGDWGLASPRSWAEAIDAIVELNYALCNPLRSAITRTRISRRLQRNSDPPLVDIGCGSAVSPGWWGIDYRRHGADVYYADLRDPLPFPQSSVAGILAEHVIEHLFFDDLPRLLAECHRVLRQGAPIRIVSPDARKIARLVLSPESREAQDLVAEDHRVHHWPRTEISAMRTANRLSHQWGQHISLVDPHLVIEMLTHAGFTSAIECEPGMSRFFSQVPDRHQERFPRSSEAFAVEAVA